MNDNSIRQLIQQEIYKARQMGSFNLQNVNRHEHNRISSNPINQSNIIPGLKAEGSIKFAQQTTYTIGLTFNPSAIFVQGNVIGTGGAKFFVTGNAQFGPSYYMQPESNTSVVIGGPQQNILQSTAYFGLDSASSPHALVGEGHIVDVSGFPNPPGTAIYARATITKYSSNAIYVNIDNLASGWEMNLSFTVT